MSDKKHRCKVKPLVGSGDGSSEEFEISCRDCKFEFTATSETFAEAIRNRHETVGDAHGK